MIRHEWRRIRNVAGGGIGISVKSFGRTSET